MTTNSQQRPQIRTGGCKRPLLMVFAAGFTILVIVFSTCDFLIINHSGVACRIGLGWLHYPEDWSVVRGILYPRCTSAGVPPAGLWVLPRTCWHNANPFSIFGFFVLCIAMWAAALGQPIRNKTIPMRWGIIVFWNIAAFPVLAFFVLLFQPSAWPELAFVPYFFCAVGMPLLHQELLLMKKLATSNPLICRFCQYNLYGNVSGICPECGTPTDQSVP